ncbi:homoserine O- acetyltransferase [Mortierella alpina]|uniref:Homoserine O- acetyltransferase n=1 Tax=Mortierella alpina TaxID=64518 RepID=A0A9P6IW06_MORAP|nr:homoserine O- acetyltransferase [Mortierella alpina]
MSFERRTTQPENPLSRLAPDQTFAIVPEFTFESGFTIRQVPVAYKTWGVLNESGDNCMLICHPLTRSVDVEDWWSTLMGDCNNEGEGRAIDDTKFFVVCLNVMGSPYGSASPLTTDPETGNRYGPEFPLATIRDDCRLHKLVLDDLGVKSIAICIGGSMAGMHALEWAFFGEDYIKLIVPVAAPAKSSAWSISWTESQRQSIFTDPKYLDGYYALNAQPLQGMTAARMTAMLTYRTRDSYERRFGRDIMKPSDTDPSASQEKHTSASQWHRQVHNEGHHLARPSSSVSVAAAAAIAAGAAGKVVAPPQTPESISSPSGLSTLAMTTTPPIYAAHSYLRYQANKFNERFDANCYIALSRKMDAHDVSLGRGDYEQVLQTIKQPVLVLGIETDILYPLSEMKAISDLLPNSEMIIIETAEGHDGILLEHEQVNKAIVDFMRKHSHTRDILAREGVASPGRKGPRASLFASW